MWVGGLKTFLDLFDESDFLDHIFWTQEKKADPFVMRAEAV